MLPWSTPARADADLVTCAVKALASSGHGSARDLHDYVAGLMADPMFVQKCMQGDQN